MVQKDKIWQKSKAGSYSPFAGPGRALSCHGRSPIHHKVSEKLHNSGTLLELSGTFGGTSFMYALGTGESPANHQTDITEEIIMYFDTIAKNIAERTGCDIATIKPESKFTELGIDSLDVVEILMNLEDEIGMEIELDQKIETVDDLDKFIQSKQGK